MGNDADKVLIKQACYNIFVHPLRVVPGPGLAKVLPQYMTPSLIEGRRAQVGLFPGLGIRGIDDLER